MRNTPLLCVRVCEFVFAFHLALADNVVKIFTHSLKLRGAIYFAAMLRAHMVERHSPLTEYVCVREFCVFANI